MVDGQEYRGQSPGDFQGLDLNKPLYIGGMPNMIETISRDSGFRQGFVGKN